MLKDPPSTTWAQTSKLYNLPWTFLSEAWLTKTVKAVISFYSKSNKQLCLLNRFFFFFLMMFFWKLTVRNHEIWHCLTVPSKIISCTMNGTHSMCWQTFPLKTNNKKKVVLITFRSHPLPVPFFPSLFFSPPHVLTTKAFFTPNLSLLSMILKAEH